MRKRSALVVWAFAWVLVPLAVWAANPEKALKEYANHEFDQAIKSCEGGKDFLSRLIAGLSYEEKAALYKSKPDREQASAYRKVLQVSVSMGNVPDLERVLKVEGNTRGNKVAAKLLTQALKSALTPEELIQVCRFLDPNMDVSVNRIALGALNKRLKAIRAYVNKGGSMPDGERKLFTNTKFIRDIMSALYDKRTGGMARSCLVQIEEPALPELEKVELTRPTSDTIVAIKKAIEVRKKRFPESEWFSASGF